MRGLKKLHGRWTRYGRTSGLLDWIGPVGQFGENSLLPNSLSLGPEIMRPPVCQVTHVLSLVRCHMSLCNHSQTVRARDLQFWHNVQQLLSLRGCRLQIIMDQDPCKSDLKILFWFFYADNFNFYAYWRISNNICHFVNFEKSKTTCPFNGNEASILSYLAGLLTNLPGEHIPLL